MIWGSLIVIVWFSLLYCFPFVAILTVQYIYSCLLVYMCCRIFALRTTWFVNSPFSCGELSLVPSSYNKKAQGPCLSLGLDTVKKWPSHPLNSSIYLNSQHSKRLKKTKLFYKISICKKLTKKKKRVTKDQKILQELKIVFANQLKAC